MSRGMKKQKVPGDVITMKTRLDEHPLIMEWINSQSNHGDSIRYLIEQEIIRRGGVYNLQYLIPTHRNLEELMIKEKVTDSHHTIDETPVHIPRNHSVSDEVHKPVVLEEVQDVSKNPQESKMDTSENKQRLNESDQTLKQESIEQPDISEEDISSWG